MTELGGVRGAMAPYRYRVFGLTIELDRAAPRLPEAGADRTPPLAIAFGRVPAALDPAETGDAQFQANDREYLFRYPGRWAVHVRDGAVATFDPGGAMEEEQIWYLAITNAAAIAGYQRGYFPIHGSGVLFGGGVVAFVGQSGAGKTTALAGLGARGHALFADDLCLVRPEGGRHLVGRGAGELRLVRDAATALGWDLERSIGHLAARDKFAFSGAVARHEDAPLIAVVELAFGDGPARLERLAGVEPFRSLVAAIRLRMSLHRFPESRRLAAFALVSKMAQDIPVYRFVRPRDFAVFDAGLDILEAEFGE